MKRSPIALTLALLFGAGMAAAAHAAPVAPVAPKAAKPFLWENATVYFLLTDRFSNGDRGNDLPYGRKADAAPLRGYMGGDLKGLTAKIKSGYFDSLGVDVLWITPPVEQLHGSTDEGTGKSYGFHGYWARDWTAVDASLGTEKDFKDFVDAAHARGIRVLLDVVMNQIGPVTEAEPAWPADWVRLDPVCQYKDVPTNVDCVLVKGLPDLLTGSDAAVALPEALAQKWKKEGRYEREVKELDEFFARTGYPRAPRYHLMKWHADWVRKYGIDGFRADTVKHVQPAVWKELRKVADDARAEWAGKHPGQGDGKFFMVAEVYGYNIASGQHFDMGDGTKVNFYQNGFDGMINFGLVHDAKQDYESLFGKYGAALQGPLAGYSVLNYTASHDDGGPFDGARAKPFETANKLLLAPGAAQIYYGDETARLLNIADAQGDAKLRSFMNWDELAKNVARKDGGAGYRIADVRAHWGKLGRFRRAHPAVGAGVHEKVAERPYTFKRVYEKNGVSDKVVVALDVPAAARSTIKVGGAFADGQKVKDYYSGASAVVRNGEVTLPVKGGVALIAP
ncbi:alpha-amylase [Pseudoduganella namucuonensis]|uniref:Alpha-amylase n=1 Tax=Pseudoduganella namucuonensis TaxID=1035707 RepID=A0A1I7FIQ7_9BURK|nr:alpha-amylase family glycosyl hydrolase [Pseudoduganella namucuonensis]SFU36060.1 alpha-amylase [Pseudoduganella namucuonensis]